MRRGASLLALGLALQSALGCSDSSSDEDRRDVKRWLVCGDCTGSELDRVLAMGSDAERYLMAAIADGPTAADDSIVVRQTEEQVLRARRYRAERQVPDSISVAESSALVVRQLDDFRLRYRLRAMQALQRIDARRDSVAVRALCANPPPELVNQPAFRAQYARFGICP